MKNNLLVIIGGDAAGMSAASKVRRVHPDKQILVFEKSDYTSYSACGIPYFISGLIESADKLVRRSPQEFRNKYNIDVRTQHLVISVDTNNKRIKVLNKSEQQEFWQPYDQLLIATGGKAYCPTEIKGHNADNVFGVTTLKSGINIENFLKAQKPKTAVIIGGGYIGLEMAEAFLTKNIAVTVVNRSEQLMNTLDPDMGSMVTKAVVNLGATVYNTETLTGFEVNDNTVTTVITDKRIIKTDMVVFGMGSAPNTAFLEGSGIVLGVRNAIKVNAQMQTNIPDVWAAGDCTETLHLVSKKQFYVALGTVANKTGLVAGSSIAGEAATFPGAVGTAVCKVCSYEVGRTGLMEKDLKNMGIEYATTIIDSTTRADYYPGKKKITVKLLAEKNSGRLLGGQIIGEEDAAKRIDIIALAVTHNLTIQNIIDMDLSYAPPFSPVWDPVQVCARKLIKMI